MYKTQAIATRDTQGGRRREKKYTVKEEEKPFWLSSLIKLSLFIKGYLCFTLKSNCSDYPANSVMWIIFL